MKMLSTAAVALLASGLAAAPFLTPSMVRRNGLTDEQYEALWAAGRNPRVGPAEARDWMRRAYRYQNVTNWLDIIGATNDFARLSNVLQADNFRLTETNNWLSETNYYLQVNCYRLADAADYYWQESTNQLAQTLSYSNRYEVANALAERANAKIAAEIAELEADAEKYDGYATRYPLVSAIFTALADSARLRIEVLKSVTGEDETAPQT